MYSSILQIWASAFYKGVDGSFTNRHNEEIEDGEDEVQPLQEDR